MLGSDFVSTAIMASSAPSSTSDGGQSDTGLGALIVIILIVGLFFSMASSRPTAVVTVQKSSRIGWLVLIFVAGAALYVVGSVSRT